MGFRLVCRSNDHCRKQESTPRCGMATSMLGDRKPSPSIITAEERRSRCSTAYRSFSYAYTGCPSRSCSAAPTPALPSAAPTPVLPSVAPATALRSVPPPGHQAFQRPESANTLAAASTLHLTATTLLTSIRAGIKRYTAATDSTRTTQRDSNQRFIMFRIKIWALK